MNYVELLADVNRELAQLSLRSSLTAQEDRRYTGLVSMAASYRSLLAAESAKNHKADSTEDAEYRKAFRSYMRTGTMERRTYSGMSIATDSDGGYFAPQSLMLSVTSALKLMDGLWNDDVITLYYDDHGNALRCPLVDDTGVAAVQIGENQSSDEAELGSIGGLTLGKIPTWRSQKLVATLELVEDSAFPFESAIISPAIATRFQRGISSANVSTLISSTTSGATCETSGIVTYDDLVELEQSVDHAYRLSSKCFWGMHPTTWKIIEKLKDAQGRPIFGYLRYDALGRPLIFGKPVILMPSLPTPGTSGAQGVVVFGDFSRCVRRIVKNSMTILRYTNAPGLIENGLIAYEGFLRTSFGVLSQATSDSPIKYLTAL